LDVIEQLAKIIGIIAIPVVIPIALAIYSARVQAAAQTETINRDYVQLAVSLLKEKKDVIDPGMRGWAVDLLAEHSPTKFKPDVISALKSGKATLPGDLESLPTVSVASPDRQTVLHAFSSAIRVWDVRTQRTRLSMPIHSEVEDLNFSPDGSMFVAGFMDGSVLVYKVANGQLLKTFKVETPVIEAQFAGSDKVTIHSVGGEQVFELRSKN
jgi:WD40 repeat protein